MLKKFFVFIYISFVICTLLSNKVFATENFTTNNLENICDETGISDILSKYADNEILQKITNVFNDELLEQDDEFSRNEKLKHLTETQIEEVVTMYMDKSIKISDILSKYNILIDIAQYFIFFKALTDKLEKAQLLSICLKSFSVLNKAK